jgi:hypothetical protein
VTPPFEPPLSERASRTGRSALLGLLFASACAHPFAEYAEAKRQAPDELACPRDEVSQDHHSTYAYTFQGCGRWVIYRCMSFDDRVQCGPIARGSTAASTSH